MAWVIELEAEVEEWLLAADDVTFGAARHHIDLLESHGVLLGEPATRQLRGKLRELRFRARGIQYRITYFVAPGGQIMLLTVFRKSRPHERAEIDRAEAAMMRCLAEHQHGEATDGNAPRTLE